ncbi:hypothetical protein PanWU01x14_000910 [Parasponia andersonii]|uniref:Uncharacterized protein n=1 Tax=Parasponia andersonii TaxID=3476 RepID=A0A2P5E4Q6_PARAD|nr:hypothetical protein PanWU01x14_000910 [Parasponia andersonii]
MDGKRKLKERWVIHLDRVGAWTESKRLFLYLYRLKSVYTFPCPGVDGDLNQNGLKTL